MKTNLEITLAMLIGLTLFTALVVFFELDFRGFAASLILGMAALKFYLVAFEFMELRKAHVFWKTATIMFCLVVVSIVAIFALSKSGIA